LELRTGAKELFSVPRNHEDKDILVKARRNADRNAEEGDAPWWVEMSASAVGT
jgi:hypothetical protein